MGAMREMVAAAFVGILISRLSSDDIYNQTQEYPDPSHRSIALATQVCFFLCLRWNSHAMLCYPNEYSLVVLFGAAGVAKICLG